MDHWLLALGPGAALVDQPTSTVETPQPDLYPLSIEKFSYLKKGQVPKSICAFYILLSGLVWWIVFANLKGTAVKAYSPLATSGNVTDMKIDGLKKGA